MSTESLDSKAYLEDARKLTDQVLLRYLPSKDDLPKSLHTAMRYSVMAGGKRLRPILALAAYEYCGGRTEGEDFNVKSFISNINFYIYSNSC